MIGFVFPSDFMNGKKPDEFYAAEYNALKDAGFPVYLINIDDLDDTKVFPTLEEHQLIYRGWMMDEDRYEKMNAKLNHQLVVNTSDYLRSHHLPGWYESIKEFTIESVITTEVDAALTFGTLGWGRAFMKDYVKSLKTGKGSIVDSADDVDRALKDILQFKGFIEKGIIFRKVVDFDEATEQRFFVINGQVYANGDSTESFTLAEKAAKNHDAFFFSIDVAKDKEGKLFIIEIGDGQVSDTVGWELSNFVEIFNGMKNQKRLKP